MIYERYVLMKMGKTTGLLLTLLNVSMASQVTMAADVTDTNDEILNLDFIEFLGQITQVEELGIDIDTLLDMKEAEDPQTDQQEQSE